MNKSFCIRKNGDVSWITYPLFEKEEFIVHASSTREGGVSENELGKMNFGAATRDSSENIRRNYEIFCKATGINIENIVISSQYHNANIKLCTKNDCGSGVLRPLEYSDIDGLVSNESGVTLCVFSADCIPVLFADAENKAVGACHCGWKGTFKKLSGLTADAMHENFGSSYENLKAVIAYGIRGCCYEVSEELYMNFISEFPRIENTCAAEIREGRFYLDLQEINKQILLEKGLKDENINVARLCTCCNAGLLHSHRATAGKRGIMGHFIGIK